MKGCLLLVFSITLLTTSSFAGAGKEGTITGSTPDGKTKLNIKIWDVDGDVSLAQLITGKDTIDFTRDCTVFKIIDIHNHVLSLYFQQKGAEPDDMKAKVLKVWALPDGFECNPAWSFECKFKVKIIATYPSGKVSNLKLDCNLDWQP